MKLRRFGVNEPRRSKTFYPKTVTSIAARLENRNTQVVRVFASFIYTTKTQYGQRLCWMSMATNNKRFNVANYETGWPRNAFILVLTFSQPFRDITADNCAAVLLSTQRICRRHNFGIRLDFVEKIGKTPFICRQQVSILESTRKSDERCRWNSVWTFLEARLNDRHPHDRLIRSPSRHIKCAGSPIQSEDSRWGPPNQRFPIQLCVLARNFCMSYIRARRNS